MLTNIHIMKKSFLVTFFCILLAACGGSSGGSSEPASNLLQTACGTLGLQEKIINGTECNPANSPVVPLILSTSSGELNLCSGTLLTQEHVLTAAHCVNRPSFTSASVIINNQEIPATEVHIHPGYRQDFAAGVIFNDVAILKLSQAVNRPVQPLLMSRTTISNDLISIFGFGLDEKGDLNVLKSGQMQLGSVSEHHLFAPFDGQGSNPCFGDSGGPAIISFETGAGEIRTGIVGIVSTGRNETCLAGDITVFGNTQASDMFDFILSLVPGAGVV